MHSSLLLVTCILVSLFASCGTNPDGKSSPDTDAQLLQAAASQVQDGDILLRSGRDFTSYQIRALSDHDKTYSHAGIAIVKNGKVFVYHITPPELEEPASDTAVRLEPLEKFASSTACFGFGIVRYRLRTTEKNRLLRYCDSIYAVHIGFDGRFDPDNPDKLYCSEMIANALSYASAGRIRLCRKQFTAAQAKKAARYFHAPEDFVAKQFFIPIDCLALHPEATIVGQFNYSK
ncbi:MAG: hypothetical protein KGO82_01360 [Bacteroidota bacterium]|nr:hypothetical protein [Bacteroidota bacterium]